MMNLSIHVPRRYAFRATAVPHGRAKQFLLKSGIFVLLLAGFSSSTDPEGLYGNNDPGVCTDQNGIFASDAPSGWNGFTTLADFYDTFEKEGADGVKPASRRVN